MNGILILIALGIASFSGGNSIKKHSKENTSIVMEVGFEKIPLNEFEAIFRKNNNDDKIEQEYLDNYTQLFVDFRRKVLYAQELKLDTSVKFISELSGYRKQLAKPYLTDQVAEDKLVKEAYERMQNEVRASHILISVKEDASDKEVNQALSKIKSLRTEIINGADFSALAKANSQDPSAESNGGDLGYFSAFKMLYSFESAAYNTEVGNVSEPFRTQYGFHILKVTDKRINRGEVKVAHIMIEERNDATKEEIIANQEKLKQLNESLENGVSFDEMVKFSDDKMSKNKNGVLQWFSTGQMVPEFEDIAFGLQKPGDISKPVKTIYGWHVLKLIDKRSIPVFEEAKDDIERKVKRDSRGNGGKKALINSIKKQNKFIDFSVSIQDRLEIFYDIKNLNYTFNTPGKTLFKLANKKYTQNDFLNYLVKNKSRTTKKMIKSIVKKSFNEWVDQSCINYEDSQLENKYPEFKALMKEYHDGIMLFDLMDQKVWSKAINDTVGLQQYYELTKENYLENEYAHVTAFKCLNSNISNRLRTILKDRNDLKNLSKEEISRLKFSKGDDLFISDDHLLSIFNYNNSRNLQIESKKISKGEILVVDEKWSEGITENDSQLDGSIILYNINELKLGVLKTFEDAKGQIISDYQNYLEENWKKELSKKYSVVIYKDILYTILK